LNRRAICDSDAPCRRIRISSSSRSEIDGAIGSASPNTPPGPLLRTIAFGPMAAREQLSIELDAEVAAILRAHAAEAHVSEGEIVDRAIRAYDLRALIARIRERSDLDEGQAMALAREELQAARAERDKAA
jgi:hypothetical protein